MTSISNCRTLFRGPFDQFKFASCRTGHQAKTSTSGCNAQGQSQGRLTHAHRHQAHRHQGNGYGWNSQGNASGQNGHVAKGYWGGNTGCQGSRSTRYWGNGNSNGNNNHGTSGTHGHHGHQGQNGWSGGNSWSGQNNGRDCIGGGHGRDSAYIRETGGKVQIGNRYELTVGDAASFYLKDNQTGSTTRVWGDPHVDVGNDGTNDWDFSKNSTFMLADGTKISVRTTNQDSVAGSLTDRLLITNTRRGGSAVEVTGIAQGKASFNESWNGRALDRATDDGDIFRQNGNAWDH